jgi:hypothetical protein
MYGSVYPETFENKNNNYEERIKNLAIKIKDLQTLFSSDNNNYNSEDQLEKLEKDLFSLMFALNQSNEGEKKNLIGKTNLLREQLIMLRNWEIAKVEDEQSEALDIITILNTIFLPLGFLTSFFGMNFASMGEGSMKNKKGTVLGWSLYKVIAVMLLSVGITGTTLYYIKK